MKPGFALEVGSITALPNLKRIIKGPYLNLFCSFRWAVQCSARCFSCHATAAGNGICPSSVSHVYQFIMIGVAQSVKIFLNSAGNAIPLYCLFRSVFPFITAPLGGVNLP